MRCWITNISEVSSVFPTHRRTDFMQLSPGRMPMYHLAAGAIVSQIDRLMLGIFEQICHVHLSRHVITNFACSSVREPRHRGSVIVILPRLRCSMRIGITCGCRPRSVARAADRVFCAPANRRLHEHFFRAELVAPYRLNRVHALSC